MYSIGDVLYAPDTFDLPVTGATRLPMDEDLKGELPWANGGCDYTPGNRPYTIGDTVVGEVLYSPSPVTPEDRYWERKQK